MEKHNNRGKPTPVPPELFPHAPRQGSLPGTIENMKYLLSHYGVSVRYDVIQRKLLIGSDLWARSSEDSDNTAMAQVTSLACLNRFPRNNITDFVAAIGDANPYNPVDEWIQSRPWDGVDRLDQISATLVACEDYPIELKELLIRKWLLSAVAAACLDRPFRSRGVLTLQGPQGIGKTQWVASLVPDPILRARVVKLDHHMDPHNKDSILGAASHWIVELGELDSALRRDIARLKGVLTRDSDKVRKPYARTECELRRRTVFAATVNHPKFLADDTGNSRFWTIAVKGVNWRHEVDMQQLFAQLLIELKNGAEWWLSDKEERQLDNQNRLYRSISVIEEMVLDALDLDRIGDPKLQALTATEMLRLLAIDHPTNPQCKECAGVLRAYLGESRRIQGRDKWRVPLRPDLEKGSPGFDEYD